MKNLFSLLPSFALLFALGCGGEATTTPAVTEPTPETPAAEAPATEAPATEPTSQTPPSDPGTGPLTCDAANPLTCRTDADCACGSSLSTGACAVGTAACIDTTKQCPDFCTGIDGRMTVKCQASVCTQVHQ